MKTLCLRVLHHACGNQLLGGRTCISPIANHEQIGFAMWRCSDGRDGLRGKNGGAETDGLPQKAATSDLQIHCFGIPFWVHLYQPMMKVSQIPGERQSSSVSVFTADNN